MGLELAASQANFIMVALPSEREANRVFETMLAAGVIIRPLRAFGLPNCLRISTGSDEDNRMGPHSEIAVRVNGEERGRAAPAGIETEIAASGPLLPGEVITRAIAFKGEPPRAGDVVEIEMPAVGTLRNRLA